MTAEKGSEPSHKSFRYLLTGYFLVVIGVLLTVFTTLGSFSRGNPSPVAVGTALSINSFGFLVVAFSHVYYLRKKGYISILDKKFFGAHLIKYISISLAFMIPIIGNVAFILTNIYDITVSSDEISLFLPVSVIIFISTLVALGIVLFNIFFALVGPVYIIVFYYSVVRRSGSR